MRRGPRHFQSHRLTTTRLRTMQWQQSLPGCTHAYRTPAARPQTATAKRRLGRSSSHGGQKSV